MKRLQCLAVVSWVCFIASCASPLTATQKVEYQAFKEKGLLIEQKSPKAAVGLGFLPGLGSFYGEEYGYGIVNLFLWPVSVMWDPISGYNASRQVNYQVTKASLEMRMGGELAKLDERLVLGSIDVADYIRQKNEIKKKYMAGY
jgi:uncharacterized membrane protein